MNILIIKLRHLGDVLITTPCLTALKEAYPQARITMVVNQGTEDMVRDNPCLSEVVALERAPKKKLWDEWRYQKQFISHLRRKCFDLSIDFSGGDRGAILSWLAGAGQRIGYHPRKRNQWWWKKAFTRTVKTSGADQHVVDHHLEAVRLLGINPPKCPLRFYWKPADEDSLNQILLQKGFDHRVPYVVVHPTSRWMFKTWRLEGYAQVIDHIQQNLGWTVLVTSGPDIKELDAVREISRQCQTNPVDLSGQLNLKQLGCLIAGGKFFFGVDSAPMHIAAAVETPVLALFGPSGDHMWGPWGEGHLVIKKDWDCRPCGEDGCQGSKVSRCLMEITTDEVISGIETLRHSSLVTRHSAHL
ncbi:MAG: putative lipopolysaccharide heptosyltransferase III [Pseudomonadota bacterium]